MKIRQSSLKLWSQCPLKYRYQFIDGLQRETGASAAFGSCIHDCVEYLEVTRDLPGALARFEKLWINPAAHNPDWRIDYYVRGTNWRKFMLQGRKVLEDWWSIIQWDTDLVLAREYQFTVPIGDSHELTGTVDKVVVRYRADIDSKVLLIVDYKTNRKVPTYEYLNEDLQFSAYAYASTRPEFWAGLPGGRGMDLMAEYADLPRYGEWIALSAMKRMDAGVREPRHYRRLAMAVNGIADSIAMRIFPPTISGEACRFCEFRKQCGMPEIEEDDA